MGAHPWMPGGSERRQPTPHTPDSERRAPPGPRRYDTWQETRKMEIIWRCFRSQNLKKRKIGFSLWKKRISLSYAIATYFSSLGCDFALKGCVSTGCTDIIARFTLL